MWTDKYRPRQFTELLGDEVSWKSNVFEML